MIETVELPTERQTPSSGSLDADTLSKAAIAMQEAFNALLNEDSVLSGILDKIISANVEMVVFGGWARDRLIEHLSKRVIKSRDIDFVINSMRPISQFFPSHARENPFGGIGINGDVMPIEAWNLHKTFLFKRRGQKGNFAELPATADYDVNALLFYPSQFHGKPSILDVGAGNALKAGRLDFMANVVAQPKIQAARAVILAAKLDLEPSAVVCDFVQDVCEESVATNEVINAIETYCPPAFASKAKRLLAEIRQGGMGGRPKTEYFFHCWGVFEGGGVRAAAHAGAYTAAKRAGVTFGRVAGTSGGSIVAALVAAGAKPAYLKRHLQELDFLPLLDKPSKKNIFFEKRSIWVNLLRFVTYGDLRKAADIAVFGGLHDSTRVGNWIEERLVELVRDEKSTNKKPVRFSELPIPLYIVATDFSTGNPKVWSQDTTGEESVSLAVRHSCSIPFFFQPVASGSAIYLDGGAVSNLPAYALNIKNEKNDERDVLSRILAFRLTEDQVGGKPVQNLLDFSRRLSGAVIDSASEIQLQLQPNVYPVHINTGLIQSTDFGGIDPEKKRFLFGRGVDGVREFIAKEKLNVLRGDATTQEFQGFDEKMLLLVRQMHICKETFLAIGRNTYWLDHGFPSLLLLLRRKVSVCVLVTSLSDLPSELRNQEARRRNLLNLLGAQVTVISGRLPLTGFAFDLRTTQASLIATYLPADAHINTQFKNERIRLYTADKDPVVMEILAEQMHALIETSTSLPALLDLKYAPCEMSKLVSRLRKIPAYNQATIQMKKIQVGPDILVMQKRIKEFKALQMRSFMSDLADRNVNFFGLMQVQLADSHSSIVTPPVLEEHSGMLVVIEGNARLHNCFTNGIYEVEAVVISGPIDPLPSDGRLSLGSLRLVSSTISMPENYKNLTESNYRHIERVVHESYD
jgi:predicted acylesterase/phospholipase RssA